MRIAILLLVIVLIAALIPAPETASVVQPTVQPAAQPVTVEAFTAVWCLPCQLAKPKLDRLERSGVRVIRHDVDREPLLAALRGIKQVPTFIVIIHGVKRRTSDIDELVRWVKE